MLALAVARTLARAVGLAEDSQTFSTVIDAADRVTFTRDPFDRIITAQAIAAKDVLVTKDARILAAYPRQAVWA
ncbi:hypothetical protein CLV47_101480 [Antricoccus suffuscus]|uniref:PIN domain-containing protein n=1 Tax=Antricoccus suffuscus TaxID=1629062 RepID=A0A2T1A721_9ACTN|nr:hypothetical protein [Antricoccus suffuscus]PRZ44354.1 hypothetical protein CLV47_101480 [Antricoccus suffuscus]